MRLEDVQRNWDAFGERDALRAILVQPDEWSIDEFFKTGEQYVGALIERLDGLGLAARDLLLDFGCGVGRLTQAFAPHFGECCGVDIAPSMVAHAIKFNRFGDRVRYVANHYPDLRQFPTSSFDLVFSVIVLQHMEPDNAIGYIREFFRVCSQDGAVVFQVPSGLARTELPREGYAAEISARVPERVVARSVVPVQVVILNASPIPWNNDYVTGIRIGYRWIAASKPALAPPHTLVPLPQVMQAGETIETALQVEAPARAGRYTLELDLVHEGLVTFREKGSPGSSFRVEIVRTHALSSGKRMLRGLAHRNGRKGLGVRGPKMEMHCIPEAQVLALIHDCGATAVAVDETHDAEAWQSFTYFAKKTAD